MTPLEGLRRHSHGGPQLPRCQSVEGPGHHGLRSHARQCPAGGDPRPGVRRGSRRGASTLASGGAKRHQTSLCSFPRIRAPRGLQGAQGSPFHPAGPRSSGQTTSGSDAAIPPPTKESWRREGRTRGRGRAWAPETQPGAPARPTTAPAADPALLGVGAPRRRAGLRTSGWRGRSVHRRAGRPRGRRPPRPAGGQGRAAHGLTRRPQSSQRRGPPDPGLRLPRHRLGLRPSMRVCGRQILYLGLSAPSPPREQGTLVLKTTTSYHFTLFFFFEP